MPNLFNYFAKNTKKKKNKSAHAIIKRVLTPTETEILNQYSKLKKLYKKEPEQYINQFSEATYNYALLFKEDQKSIMFGYLTEAVNLYENLPRLYLKHKKAYANMLTKIADIIKYDSEVLALSYIEQAISLYDKVDIKSANHIKALKLYSQLFTPSKITTSIQLGIFKELFDYEPKQYINQYAQALYYYGLFTKIDKTDPTNFLIHFRKALEIFNSLPELSTEQKLIFADLITAIFNELDITNLNNLPYDETLILSYLTIALNLYKELQVTSENYIKILELYIPFLEKSTNYDEAAIHSKELIALYSKNGENPESSFSQDLYALYLYNYLSLLEKTQTFTDTDDATANYYEELIAIIKRYLTTDNETFLASQYERILSDYINFLLKNKRLIKAKIYNTELLKYYVKNIAQHNEYSFLYDYEKTLKNHAHILEKLKCTDEGITILKEALAIYKNTLNNFEQFIDKKYSIIASTAINRATYAKSEKMQLDKMCDYLVAKIINYLQKANRIEETKQYQRQQKMPLDHKITHIAMFILCIVWFSTLLFQETFYQPIAYYLLGKPSTAIITDPGIVNTERRWGRGIGFYTYYEYHNVGIRFQLPKQQINTTISIYNKNITPILGQQIDIRYLAFKPSSAIPQANINWIVSLMVLILNIAFISFFIYYLKAGVNRLLLTESERKPES